MIKSISNDYIFFISISILLRKIYRIIIKGDIRGPIAVPWDGRAHGTPLAARNLGQNRPEGTIICMVNHTKNTFKPI